MSQILWPRRRILEAGAVVLSLGVPHIACGAGILTVRVWPAQDYTRVTIESDAALKTETQFVPNPPRLAVDIEGIVLNPALRELVAKVQADDPNIAGVRVGQFSPTVVRLVLDLKHAVRPQVFSLLPVAAYQHRLVMDLYPLEETDPLEALIATHAQAKEPDPLDSLIAQHSGPSGPNRSASAPRPVASGTPSARTGASAPASPKPSAPKKDNEVNRLIIVALDPGHGGEDPGAIGPAGTQEKHVVLKLAFMLRDRLNTMQINGQPVRAFLTRDGDYFVPLGTRVQKARKVQADLFISLHADAFFTPDPQGASVFALSDRGATSAAARWMAQRENLADAVGGLSTKQRDVHLERALLDMSTTAQIKDSVRLGGKLLQQIGRVGRLHKPRVEQANFAVLKAPDIPSVLVEAAFISNPREEERLNSPDYLGTLADAVVKGVAQYFASNPPLARQRRPQS